MIFLNSLEQRIAPLLVLNYEKIEEINKPFKLTLRATKGLEKNDRIIFEEKEYVVTGVEEINGQDLTVEIYAEESITELSGNLILDKRPTSLLAALQAVTENTRWNIGSYPATTGKSLSFFRNNSLEALNQTLEAYGLEMETEYNFGSPISRTLHLRNRVGESRGRRTTLHTDAVEVKRIVHDDDVVTRLYGYGKGESLESGGYGRRLDISTVNGGIEYIEDNNARLAYGIGADRLHRDAVLIYEDIEDPNELKTAMIADFEILKTPKVTYDGTMADLGLFDDKLGDDITILDEVLGIAVKGRILKLAKTNDKKQVTIGSLLPSFRSEIDRIKDIENRIRDFDVIRNAVVNLDNVDYLNGVIERINTELNATTGYASLIPSRGIVIPNASDEASATQVIELGGGYWRIANSKDAFGNWEYRTIADGRGIIATEIIAGILKGGQVEFNLEAGTFIIGNPTNPSLLWDGANLIITGDSIQLTGTDAISLKVQSETTTVKDDLERQLNQVSTEVTQLSDSFNYTFNYLEERVEANETHRQEVQSNITFDTDDDLNPQMRMGRSDRDKELILNYETGLRMVDGGVTTFEASDQQVFTTRLVVLQSINFGNHVAEKHGTEFTIFNPVGGV